MSNCILVLFVILAAGAFATAWALCRIAAIADEYTIHDEDDTDGND